MAATRLKPAAVALLLAALLGCQVSAESDANSVEIKLYPASLSDWPSSTETAFASTVADQATVYCGSNPSACGLDNGNTFSSADVNVHSKSEASRSLKISLYVSYPANSSVTSGGSTTVVLPLAALKAILKDARDSVKTAIDMYITYIGSDYYGVPPESKMNGIVIPIATVTVVAVGISAVVMVYAQEHREKKEKMAARLAKKRSAKPMPNYDIAEIPANSENPINVHAGVSSEIYHNNEISSLTFPSTQSHPSKEMGKEATPSPSVNHFHANGSHKNLNILPPLSSISTMTAITDSTAVSSNHEELHGQQPPQQPQYQHHQQQQQQQEHRIGEASEAEEEKRRRKKEKKREKKRLLQQQHVLLQQQQELQDGGFELHDNHGFDTSAMTISDNSVLRQDVDTVPTFTVQRRGEVA